MTSSNYTTPQLPSSPGGGASDRHSWYIDMNYLMPFSVMLMLLCVLLLILCYLRYRMKQRRQRRLAAICLHAPVVSISPNENGEIVSPKNVTMYPPTYEEAVVAPPPNNPPPLESSQSALRHAQPPIVNIPPPPYTA